MRLVLLGYDDVLARLQIDLHLASSSLDKLSCLLDLPTLSLYDNQPQVQVAPLRAPFPPLLPLILLMHSDNQLGWLPYLHLIEPLRHYQRVVSLTGVLESQKLAAQSDLMPVVQHAHVESFEVGKNLFLVEPEHLRTG